MGTQVVVLSGSITVGPLGASDCAFPSAVDQLSLTTFPSQKPLAASFRTQRNVQVAPPAFLALDGIGATSTVTKGTFLYFRCNSPMKIRKTMVDIGGGADIVSVDEVLGTIVQEFPDAGTLKLLEVQGTGQIEYLVGGIA